MPDYQAIYGYNFRNGTHPLPPLQSTSTRTVIPLVLVILSLGAVLSAALLFPLFRSVQNHHQRFGQRVQCIFDLLFYVCWAFPLIVPLILGEVPTYAYCQVTAALEHWTALSQFSCISALAYERYYRLKKLRDNDKASAGRVAPHWKVYLGVVAPSVVLYALLPILSSSKLGHFGPYANNAACVGIGGKGILAHDLYQFYNVVFFIPCTGITFFSLYKSIRISGALLAPPNLQMRQSTVSHIVAVRAERRMMWFSVSMSALFLLCWLGHAVFFTHAILGIEIDWSPGFTDYMILSGSTTALNPFLNLYFDPGLRKLVASYYLRRSTKRRIGSSVVRTTTTASGSGASRSSRRKKQFHAGSRVSHLDEEDGDWEVNAREADAESRGLLIEQLFGAEAKVPKEEEQAALRLGQELVLDIESKMEPKNHSNKLVELAGCARGVGLGVVALKAKVTVRAGPEDIAAFLHDYDSAYFTEAAEKDLMVRDRFVIEDGEEGRSNVSFLRIKMPTGRYRDRTVCSKATCSTKNHAGGMMHVAFPIVHDSEPEGLEDVRASCIWVYRIKPVRVSVMKQSEGSRKTVVELYTQLNFKTADPEMEYEYLRRPLTVRAVSQVQRYFQHLRPLEILDDEDGAAMAAMLVDSVAAFKKGSPRGAKPMMGRLALTVLMQKNVALRALHTKNPWFSSMLIKVLDNRPAPPSTVNKRLEELTVADGGKIGKSMAAMLLGNATAAASVDEWVRAFPSMKEFAEKAPFFRPFMETVATQQLQAADWGLKFRVGLGAAFSVLDMGSDGFVVSELFATGESGKAWAVVIMIALNILFQLQLVYVQKHKRPKIMAREMLLTILCLKPAVDARRLIGGGEKEYYEWLSPFSENTLTKVYETFFEALPAAFIQADFVITRMSNGESVSRAAFGSIAMSIMATSFAMQTIAFDYDVNPVSRRDDPKVNGYIPDKNRGLVFGIMLAIAACTMASQVFNFILLLKMSGTALAIYLVVPMVLNFARKLLRRGDFRVGPVWFTCVYIVTCKFITDVTAWMMAYAPTGLGGAGFMGNLFVNQVATLVVAGAYVGGAGAVGEQRIDGDTVWAVVLASNGVLVLSFAAFFGTVNRSHVSAFFSFETSADQCERRFREHTEPGLKLLVLKAAHESHYRHFRNEVKEYVEANIAEWESERPLWFTNNMLMGIPI